MSKTIIYSSKLCTYLDLSLDMILDLMEYTKDEVCKKYGLNKKRLTQIQKTYNINRWKMNRPRRKEEEFWNDYIFNFNLMQDLQNNSNVDQYLD